MKQNAKFIFIIILFLWNSFCLAQTSGALNTSSTSLEYSLRRFWEKSFITYESLMGVSAGKEDESEFEGKIDYDEAMSGSMINSLELGYKLGKNVSASIVGVWNIRQPDEEAGAFQALDPYAKIRFDEVIEVGNFELASDLRIGAPVSPESREMKRVTTIGTEQEIEYRFGKSDVRFEMEIYFQYNVHSVDSQFDDVEARFEPALFYDFNDKTYARVSYESKMHHERHDDLALIDNRQPTLQSGVGWKMLKNKLNIYPYMDLNLRTPSTKRALYGASIAWDIH